MPDTHTLDNPKLAWRFVEGTVLKPQENIVHFTVSVANHPDILRARLAINPQSSGQYKVGHKHPLFITSPTNTDKELYYAANGNMADPKRNPWLTGQIRHNDIIEGKVIDYVEDYAVIVDLQDNITQNISWRDNKLFTGFLHIQNTPNASFPNIRNILHIDDIVQAVVVALNPADLEIRLDVNKVIELRSREAVNASNNIPLSPTLRPSPQRSIISKPRSKKKLLLIDNDIEFCHGLQAILPHWEIDVRYCHDLKKLKQELKPHHFHGCLMDCNLGLRDEEQREMIRMVETCEYLSNAGLAYITGDMALQSLHPGRTISKPLYIDTMLDWLDNGTIKNTTHQRRTVFGDKIRRWQYKGSEAFVIERARKLLEQCCNKTGADKSLWVREERPGYFVVRVPYNIESSTCHLLEEQFQNTQIADAIDNKAEREVSAHQSGPLHEILGDFGFVWIMPFGPEINKPDRALALFSRRRLTELDKDYVRDKENHMIDITHMMDATLALENSEVFATEGVVLSSTLHEIRTAASIVAGSTQRLKELINRPLLRPSDQNLRESLEILLPATQHLLELSENGLDRIRPEHEKIPNLLALIQGVLHLMRGRMKYLNTHAELSLLPGLLDKKGPIQLPYPPKFIEIPLINLLDKAILHCGNRKWAKIEVSIDLDQNTLKTPLLIRVVDNGLGMTSGQRQDLFNARKTSRGMAGSGIGLFLSKQMLEAIDGRIELEKTIRWLGSRFVIRLPLAR